MEKFFWKSPPLFIDQQKREKDMSIKAIALMILHRICDSAPDSRILFYFSLSF
jgi:hypothetical protein